MSKGKDFEGDTNDSSVMFIDEGVEVSLRFESVDQSIWATYQNIADLFGVDVSVANRHVNNVYSDGELEKPATRAK